jgi:hypothetical protein
MVGECCQQRLVELPPDHCRKRQQPVRLRGEAVEPAAEHLTDAVRDGDLGHTLAGSEHTLRRHERHHLREEEGVPLSLLIDACEQLGTRYGISRSLHEGDHLRLAQAAQVEALEEPLAVELRQHLGERVDAVEVGVAVGAEDEQAGAGKLACHVAEHQQRRAVRPVQVVEHEQQRYPARNGVQKPAHRVEETELGVR